MNESLPKPANESAHRGGAAKNFAWLVGDRGVRLVVSVVVGSWVARYLGPTEFGLLNYALSIAAVFAAVAPLGIEGVAVRDIVLNRASAGAVIGTAIALRGVCAVGCALGALALVAALRPDDTAALVLVGILGAGLIGQSLEYGEFLFRADVRMRVLVVPRMTVFLAINVVKLVLVWRGFSVGWFAALTALEQVATGLLTILVLRRYAGPSLRLSVDRARSLALLKECWPLAVAGLPVIVYMKAGQLIIGTMLGDRALGFFSAAIRVPESANFVPMVLASSLLPGLLARMREDRDRYEEAMLRYMRISVCLSLLICVPLSAGAPLIVKLLYSSEYAASAGVMAVYSWSLPFIFLGVARAQHLLNEKKNRLTLFFSMVGLVANIVLNFALIPLWGVMGAAVATVGAQAISALLASWMLPATHLVGRYQLIALFTPWQLFTSRERVAAAAGVPDPSTRLATY